MKKILLIDGNSILNRAFYGTQSSYLKNAEGLYTGALFGFMNMYLKQKLLKKKSKNMKLLRLKLRLQPKCDQQLLLAKMV